MINQTKTIRVLYYISLILIITQMQNNLSHFGKNVNFPICKYLEDNQTWPINPQKEPISLLSGDPTVYGQHQFQMPERGYDILKQSIMNQNNHGYCASNGIPQLKNAVKKLYKPKFALDINDIHINHGVNMGLLGCLIAFTNEGDQVLVPQFGYPFFENLCPAWKRVAVPYKLKKHQNFQIDLEHVATLLTEKTSFMLIINPANPTGAVFSIDHMKQILNFSDKHEIPLVVDQVYWKQVYPGVQTLSFGQLTEDTPVIILSGVQKLLSVPGWVQSWTVIFDKNHILSEIKRNLEIIATIFLHTNTFTMHALPKIFQQIGLFTIDHMPAIQQNCHKLIEELKEISQLSPILAQGTIYLSVQVDFSKLKDIHNDIQLVKKLRQQESVNILPLSTMGKSVQGLRLLTCCGDSFYKTLFERLNSFFKRHRK